MNDVEIEKVLLEKKFISNKDIELIRKQSAGNNISFKTAIEQLKRISLVLIILKIFLFFIGIDIFFSEDSTSFQAYVFAVTIGVIIMHVMAPVTLGAKLFFVSLKSNQH